MKNTKSTYIIRLDNGYTVAGFSRRHQIVQLGLNTQMAKHFNTMTSAQKFVDTYSDAGYGLTYAGTEIVEIAK